MNDQYDFDIESMKRQIREGAITIRTVAPRILEISLLESTPGIIVADPIYDSADFLGRPEEGTRGVIWV